ncbi:MAG: lipopolysaccharide assembly protein LapA domain-containing protein [Microcoleaceae cyanobacterium]
MKTLYSILTSLILAGWVSTMAILAIQNATPIALKFLTFQSIQVPIGLVLAFSVSLGAIAGAILPLLFFWSGQRET